LPTTGTREVKHFVATPARTHRAQVSGLCSEEVRNVFAIIFCIYVHILMQFLVILLRSLKINHSTKLQIVHLFLIFARSQTRTSQSHFHLVESYSNFTLSRLLHVDSNILHITNINNYKIFSCPVPDLLLRMCLSPLNYIYI
jgi:hypothetical protein